MKTSEQTQAIASRIAEFFDIEPDEDGLFDLKSYDWVSGCSLGNGSDWLTLNKVVYFVEQELLDSEIETEQEIAEALCEWFSIDDAEKDSNGEYDLDSYAFQAGCSFNGQWLNLATIIECIEDKIIPDLDYLQDLDSERKEMDEYERD